MNRPSAVKAVREAGIAIIPGSRGEIKSLFDGDYKNVFVFVDIKKTVVYQENWLDTLSKSDFFLALPGDIRPMCHNIIEAMAVGAVPITNYPEWFHPRLEDMKNCIVFGDKDDLIKKINKVLKMGNSKVREMREETLKYYDNHLSPRSFVNKIESVKGDRIEVFFNSGGGEYLSKVKDSSVIISGEKG